MRGLGVLVCLLPVVAGAGNLQVPSVAMPASEPGQPVLLLSPSDIPTLQARRTDPAYSGFYNQVKGFVDGQLGGVKANAASVGDDTLSKVAKGAALLHQLGETPASQFASYRDAAVAALKGIATRNPASLFGGGTNAIDTLRDSPRLQSMVEAYDLLRGTGVAASDDSAIRSTIGVWAEQLRTDFNVAGAFGIPGHRDNWGIKGGCALITTALGLSSDPNAAAWLQTGLQFVNESLAVTASDTGWYRESPHYLNYSLDNMISTAWHVRQRTGVDWFPAMRPFVTTALDMRQPDGSSTPFEEGVSDVFPYDVLAGSYPDLAPRMSWAWKNSSQDASAYENNALHAATRFVLNVTVPEQAPPTPTTRFVGPDAHVHVLRSDWSAGAAQATMITAKDHASTALIASRHNMQNPMDLTVYGAGQLLLPTSSGGPQVTTSADRAYYLLPSSKNVPLVSGTAPFVPADSDMTSDSRLDGTFFDAARTSVTTYAGASRVSRLLTMIDNRSFVLVDEAAGSGNIDFALPFHGRGTFTIITPSTPLVQARWDYQGASLDLWSTSAQPLGTATNGGHYASTYGSEESLTALQVKTNADSPRVLTMLLPRNAVATAPAVTPLVGATGVTVDDGTNIDTIATSTDALLTVVRTTQGVVTAFGLANGTSLKSQGVPLVSAPSPVTLSATIAGGSVLLQVTLDAPSPLAFTLQNLPGLDAVHAGYSAFINDQPAGSSFSQAGGQLQFQNIAAGSAIRVQPSSPPTLASVNAQQVAEGQPLALRLAAVDADGRALSYSMTSTPPLPANAMLNPSTGAFTWTPGYDVATPTAPAVFSVTFVASDGFLTASTTAVITVTDANGPPVFTTIAGKPIDAPGALHFEISAVAPLAFAVVATDADADVLTYSVAGPSGVAINPATGAFNWQPPPGESDTVTIQFQARDPSGASASLAVTVLVKPVDAGLGPSRAKGCGCGGATSGLPGILMLLAIRRRSRPRASTGAQATRGGAVQP
jgi:hypothetical protein